MPTLPARPSLKLIMEFTYRGATQQWSNRHFIAGGTPATAAAWLALANDVLDNGTTNFRQAISPEVTVVQAVGYEAGSEISVWTHDYSEAGVHTLSGNRCPGDCAAMIRWATDARSSKGHPIYLYSWLHSVSSETTARDTLESGLHTAISAYAEKWWDAGFTDGTNVYRRCGPQGAVAVSREVDEFVRHRDFPH